MDKKCHDCPILAIFRPYPEHIRWGPEQRLLHMTTQQDMFDERYRKVLKRHRQLSRGYVTKLEKNGVITHRPNLFIRDAFSFSMIFLPIGVLFFLKACIVTLLREERSVLYIDECLEGTSV